MKAELYFTYAGLTDQDLLGKTVVVIDVLRACTVICTAFAAGCREIIPVRSVGDGSALLAKRFGMETSVVSDTEPLWKYVEKVCAKYSELNEPINRESFGPLSATLQPPAIVIVIQIIEMLLSLEEGVKSFSVSFSQSGSFLQDIVTSNVIKKLSRHYADQFGHEDAQINLVYHQWMGAFPRNKEHSESLITTATVIAGLVGADKIITKTRDESYGIPTKESNASAVSKVQYTLGILRALPQINDEEEEENLTREVQEIMEAVFNDSADTLWRKVFNAIKKGHIEIPFSPHIINNNKVITVRDKEGNIRIYDRGDLPISDQSFAFEKSKLSLGEDKNALVSQIIQDIGIML